ncbi:unnamed protein product, partial [Amoebophrya sp. A120]
NLVCLFTDRDRICNAGLFPSDSESEDKEICQGMIAISRSKTLLQCISTRRKRPSR